MQRDEAIVMGRAALDQAMDRPGCMAVISPYALALILASEEEQKQEGEPKDAAG